MVLCQDNPLDCTEDETHFVQPSWAEREKSVFCLNLKALSGCEGELFGYALQIKPPQLRI